jgi:squalene-hopene/tetraprenyl-beta-curcumene cyclase
MSLASIEHASHPAAKCAAAFLADTVRADGSWPIDTNLATWVTTLSVNALASGGALDAHLPDSGQAKVRRWLLDQQCRTMHPYTHAAPGGWAWTPLSGGVPDADDTAGALLALWHLRAAGSDADADLQRSAAAGIRWLLDLQNKDGGIPTFCRGWGNLPFDRSTPDLTAHTLRAWSVWREHVGDSLRRRIDRATLAAARYLVNVQRRQGSWIPLWFGNQHLVKHENPLYGTTRVLMTAQVTPASKTIRDDWHRALQRGLEWLLSIQNQDGGWGADASIPSSIEETALAVEALASTLEARRATSDHAEPLPRAIQHGSSWLVQHTQAGTRFEPAPIGLYFARLWYHEQLYPLIFTVSALEQVCRLR